MGLLVINCLRGRPGDKTYEELDAGRRPGLVVSAERGEKDNATCGGNKNMSEKQPRKPHPF